MAKNFSTFGDYVTWLGTTKNDVVINANGTLQKTWIFEGRDGSSMTDAEQQAYYNGLNNLFKRLKSGFILFTECQKRRTDDLDESVFDVPILNEMEASRDSTLKGSTLYKNTYYLTIVYKPANEALQKVSKLLDTSNEELWDKIKNTFNDFRSTLKSSNADVKRFEMSAASTIENINSLEAKFLDEADSIIRGLSQYFTEIRPATTEETMTYLHSTISDRYFKVKANPTMFVSEMLSDSVFLGGREPKLGDKYVGIIGIKDLPATTQGFMFSRLNALSSEYRFVTRYMALSKEDSVNELQKIAKKFADTKKSFFTILWEAKDHITSDRVDNVESEQGEIETNEAEELLAADEFGLGYLNMNIVLLNKSKERLNDDLTEIRSLVNDLGFVATIERDNATAAWFSTIPSVYSLNVRNYLMNSTNYANISPFGSYWQGEKKNKHLKDDCLIQCVTPEHLPFYFNLHNGDVGHTLIVGATGTGKSVLLNTIAANFRKYKDSKIFVFDKSASSRVLSKAVGGNYYNLLVDSDSIAFQPLADIDNEVEKTWCLEWLVNYLSGQNIPITPKEREIIQTALDSVAASPKEERTITGLITMIQSETIRNGFRDLSLKGAYGSLFDSAEDKFGAGRWQVFEMEKIMDNNQIVGPVLDYLFHRIEGQLKGEPALMMLDECWLFFRNEAFRKKLVEYLKDFRKKNCSVVIATQNLSDIDGELIPIIKTNMPTKIYLANPLAMSEDISAIYKGFGLNEKEIQIVSTLKPKKEYYYKSEQGSRVFDLALSPIELAFLAATSTKDQQAVNRLNALPPAEFSSAWKQYKSI